MKGFCAKVINIMPWINQSRCFLSNFERVKRQRKKLLKYFKRENPASSKYSKMYSYEILHKCINAPLITKCHNTLVARTRHNLLLRFHVQDRAAFSNHTLLDRFLYVLNASTLVTINLTRKKISLTLRVLSSAVRSQKPEQRW